MALISPPSACADADPLAAALHYAGQGRAVLPLHTPDANGRCSCRDTACPDVGKHPRVQGGLKSATTDPKVIRKWWAMWPDANVGIRTGAESGLVVLDIDVAKGGRETLDQLEAAHGSLLPTLTVETGGRGLHYYFAHPGGRVRNNAGRLGPGLDLRGDGGYVVAAPSLHRSGRHYCWDVSCGNHLPLAPLPSWIHSSAQGSTGSQVPQDIEAPIPEGQRNTTLTRIAGKLRHAGLSERVIRAALLEANDERCTPPLEEEEVTKIARSIARYPAGPSGTSALPGQPGIEVSLVEEKLAQQHALVSAVCGASQNPHLKSEAAIALRIVTILEHLHAQGPTPDGFYRISDNDLADAWNRDKPIRSRATIGRVKTRLREWGLFEIQTRRGSRVMGVVHPSTGEIRSRRVPIDETWIRRDRPMLEKLQQLAAFVRPAPDASDTARPAVQPGMVPPPHDEVVASGKRIDAPVLDISTMSPMPHFDAVELPRFGGQEATR